MFPGNGGDGPLATTRCLPCLPCLPCLRFWRLDRVIKRRPQGRKAFPENLPDQLPQPLHHFLTETAVAHTAQVELEPIDPEHGSRDA